MPINSKNKGNVGEREFSKAFNDIFGTCLRRGQQYSGTAESADVVGLPGVHFEVKRVQNLNLTKTMEVCEVDCEGKAIPVIAHRKNYKPWLITIKLEDLAPFMEAIGDEKFFGAQFLKDL